MEEDLLQDPKTIRPARMWSSSSPSSSRRDWLRSRCFWAGCWVIRLCEHFVWSLQDALWGVAGRRPLHRAVPGHAQVADRAAGEVKKFCDKEVVPLFDKSSWSELALISLSAGVGEEMLFRGVLQASLGSWLGLRWGLTLASMLFGLLHPISVSYMIIAAIPGLLPGAVWIYNGNLLTVMVTHALYDFAALGYLIRLRPATSRAKIRLELSRIGRPSARIGHSW